MQPTLFSKQTDRQLLNHSQMQPDPPFIPLARIFQEIKENKIAKWKNP